MKTSTRIMSGMLLALAMSAAAVAQPLYGVAPEAPWIKVAPDSLLTADSQPVEAGESDYPLVDEQLRLAATTQRYSRYAQRLVNQAAVDSAAQISIEIDPEREHVTLHHVRVFRDGLVIDKLVDARRSMLSRESGLEEGLIDGRSTLHLLLQDVRVGDVLDYSYTNERRNPPGEHSYHEWFSTQWESPVRYYRLRTLHPQSRALHEQDKGKVGEPTRATHDGWVETQWEARDIAALQDEQGRPHWHFRYPRIELSEFADWNAVRDWALPQYIVKPAHDAKLDALVEQLRGESDEPARILRALRFVQDEIRYTGIEVGDGAWRPTQPGVVLARRYGDCKDKVLLLVTLLRSLGVEAWPALVHSNMGKGVLERQASPGAFDHVIAKVRSRGNDYWLDATASSQGGRLGTLVQADFGPALVLAPDADGLEQIPARTSKAVTHKVVEIFDLRKGTDKTAHLEVHTELRDEDADQMRVRMRTQTVKGLAHDYLDYYRKSYAGIRTAQLPNLADDRDDNVYTIDESYDIDAPFEKESDGKRRFYFEAYLVSELTRKPGQTVRSSPLARAFPKHVHHEIVAYLPGPWDIDDARLAVNDPAFEYRSELRYQGDKLELSFDMQNASDNVPAGKLKAFLANLEKARLDAFFTLTDGEQVAPPAAKGGPAVELIITMLIGMGGGILAIWLVSQHSWRLPAAEAGAPVGVLGWMLLPVLLVIGSPIRLSNTLMAWFRDISSSDVLHANKPVVQYLLLAEALLIAAMLLWSLYCAWLLVRRDRGFPFVFIGMMVSFCVALVLDLEGLILMGPPGEKDLPGAIAALVAQGIVAAPAIVYMLKSQRVRATFTRGRAPDLSSLLTRLNAASATAAAESR